MKNICVTPFLIRVGRWEGGQCGKQWGLGHGGESEDLGNP